MDATAFAFEDKVAAGYEFLEAELEGGGFAAGELDELAEGEGFVAGEEGEDLPGQRMEVVFAVRGTGVDLAGEGVLLFDEGAEEEEQPRLPIGGLVSE